MATIQALTAREILDSLTVPTIEVTLWLDSGAAVVTSVSTGTNTGKFETTDLRDNDMNHMVGKGVLKAVKNINEIIAPALIGKDPTDQVGLDQLLLNLDGTANQAKLGGNAIIAVSQAILKAGAIANNWPIYYYIQQKFQLTQTLAIPTAIFCMIDGGAHGSDNLDFQEFQIIPASFMEYPAALNLAVTLYQKLEEVLVAHKPIHSTGTLGGFSPNLMSNVDVFDLLIETIKASQYIFSQDVFFGLDAAANEIFYSSKYHLKDKNQAYSSGEMLEYYKNIRNTYKVIYFEDPFIPDDLNSWKALVADIGATTLVSADSLIDSQPLRAETVLSQKLANAIVLKPSKVATISELFKSVSVAKKTGAQIIIAHRSGETNDDLIADIAVGVGADYAKFGPVNRQERLSKYNRLSQIYLELANQRQETTQTNEVSAVTSENQPNIVAATTETEQPLNPPTSDQT